MSLWADFGLQAFILKHWDVRVVFYINGKPRYKTIKVRALSLALAELRALQEVGLDHYLVSIEEDIN